MNVVKTKDAKSMCKLYLCFSTRMVNNRSHLVMQFCGKESNHVLKHQLNQRVERLMQCKAQNPAENYMAEKEKGIKTIAHLMCTNENLKTVKK